MEACGTLRYTMGSPSSTTTTSDDDDDKSHHIDAARAMHQEEFNTAEGRLDSTRKRLFVEGDDHDDEKNTKKNNHLLHLYMGHDNRSRSHQSEQSYQSSSSSFGGSYYSTDEEEDNVLSQLLLEEHQYQHHRTSPTSVNVCVMGLEGAVEVALKDVTNGPDCSNSNSSSSSRSSLNSKHQRHQQRNPIRTSSLLDVEKTPQRNHTSSSSSVASFDTPTGTGCGGGGSSSGKMSVERTITCYLEDPTTNSHGGQDDSTCTDWQFFFFGGGGMCGGFGGTAASSDPTNPSPSRETVRSMLQRRTSHNLRARKVRQLRKDIAPFHGSPARSPAKAPSLFRNQSFSISDHRSAIARVSKDHTPRRSSFANVLQLCTMPEHTTLETPEIKRTGGSLFLSDNSEDFGYDSDPEDFTRRRCLSKKTAFSDEGSSSQSEGTHNRGFSQNNIVPSSSNASPFQPFLDPENDEMSATIVQEFFNQSSTLVFHPHSSIMMDSSDVTLSRPVAVEAWLERGQHLADSLLQPKWMWKQKGAGKNLQMQMADLHGVELLDVTRILKLEDIMADEESCSLLPFAKPSHCFVIKSIHDDELYFEARSQAERDRLVYSLKIVIARFGAKVLVGDPAVYYEFFSMSDGVPGEAPELYDLFDGTQDLNAR